MAEVCYTKTVSCPCCAQKGRAATRLASAVPSGWDTLSSRTDGNFKCSQTERKDLTVDRNI